MGEVLEMCSRIQVVGPMMHPLPGHSRKPCQGAHPQWVPMSEVLLHRVLLPEGFQDPLKILQNIVCACVCASATGPCRKGAFLECLLTFSSVSITRWCRTFICQAAFCSRDAAMSSTSRMDLHCPPGLSLPGASSRERRPCSSTLKT